MDDLLIKFLNTYFFHVDFSSKLKVRDDKEGGYKSGGFRRRNGDENGGYKKREYHDRNGDDDDQGFKKSNYRKRNEDGDDDRKYNIQFMKTNIFILRVIFISIQ